MIVAKATHLTTKEQRFFLLIMIPKLVNYMLEAYNLVFEEYTLEEVENSYLEIETYANLVSDVAYALLHISEDDIVKDKCCEAFIKVILGVSLCRVL